MLVKLEADAAAIICRLREAGYSESILSSHRRCYDSLQSYIAESGLPFTMETAVKWLERCKSGWSYATYCNYRSALFRLDRYLINGEITRTMCWSINDFSCCDKALQLPASLYKVYCDIKALFLSKYCKTSVYNYSCGCRDFLLFVAEYGCAEPTELTIEAIIAYAARLYGENKRLSGTKSPWLAGIVNLLTYLAERGDIPKCYAFRVAEKYCPNQTVAIEIGNHRHSISAKQKVRAACAGLFIKS
jgi:hypothetical protein